MFNYVNGNPFGQKIESAVSTGQENRRQQQEQQQNEEKHYLEEDDQDEVNISPLPVLSEDDIKYLVNDYISKLKSQHSDNQKTIQNLDKFLSKFDVKKFIKRNPEMTISDFNMIMFNETSNLIR